MTRRYGPGWEVVQADGAAFARYRTRDEADEAAGCIDGAVVRRVEPTDDEALHALRRAFSEQARELASSHYGDARPIVRIEQLEWRLDGWDRPRIRLLVDHLVDSGEVVSVDEGGPGWMRREDHEALQAQLASDEAHRAERARLVGKMGAEVGHRLFLTARRPGEPMVVMPFEALSAMARRMGVSDG